jgi:hypothetical protein
MRVHFFACRRPGRRLDASARKLIFQPLDATDGLAIRWNFMKICTGPRFDGGERRRAVLDSKLHRYKGFLDEPVWLGEAPGASL